MSTKNDLLEKNTNSEDVINAEELENKKSVEVEDNQDIKKDKETNNNTIKKNKKENINQIIENTSDTVEDTENENTNNTFNIANEKSSSKHIFKLILFSLIAILILCFGIFTIYNMFNTDIIHGVYIKDIDVSGMSKSDAKYQ